MVLDSMVVSVMSVIFEEYDIPYEPIKFVFEIVLFALFVVPVSFASFITYAFFRPEPKSVRGNVVLITGTARGNGRELAMQFHRLGAKVVCVDKDRAGNDETVRRIVDEGGEALGLEVDITDRRRLSEMHEAVERQMGPVDILVNNAGLIETTYMADPDADDMIEDIVNTNFLGQLWVIREILPSMLKRNSGQIVVISSLSLFRGLKGLGTYTATKRAVKGLIESLTRELKSMNSDVITTTVCSQFIANSPERSARRKLRFPELPLEDACEMIIEGILRNERIFTIPRHGFYILSFINVLPEVLQQMFEDIVYATVLPTSREEKILDKYTLVETTETIPQE